MQALADAEGFGELVLKVKDYELNRELAEQNGSVYSATPPLVMDPENPNAGKRNKIIYCCSFFLSMVTIYISMVLIGHIFNLHLSSMNMLQLVLWLYLNFVHALIEFFFFSITEERQITGHYESEISHAFLGFQGKLSFVFKLLCCLNYINLSSL